MDIAIQNRNTTTNNTTHKARTNRNHTPSKTQQTIRGKINNNIGVFQGSATSALLFIIYLQDMMDDFHALNYLQKIPYRETKQRDEQSKVNTLLTKLQQQKQSQLISTTGDKQMQQNITHPKRKSTRRNKK